MPCQPRQTKGLQRRWALALALLAWSAVGLPALAAAGNATIFVLHSYHQEYPWTKGENDGFIQALGKDPQLAVQSIYTENLDSKRVPFTEEYQEFFFRYLRDKYRNFSPDLIFCSDDNALQFLLHYHNTLFPGVPVVFCGVNNLGLRYSLDPAHYVGVYEKKELAPNIAFIIGLQPNLRDIYFLGDDSSTNEAIKVEAEKELGRLYPQLRYRFLSGKYLAPLLAELKNLRQGALFLTTIGGFYDDRQNLLTLPTVLDALSATVKLPIISMEDVYVRRGVLGGYVTSGIAQGEVAASLAARILKGEPPLSVASVLESPNVYMFHNEALNRFDIPLSRLPANSIVLERPETFFHLYRKQIAWALFFVVLQTLIIIFLIHTVGRRRQAEQALAAANEKLEARVVERTQALEQANIRLQAEILEHAMAEDKLRLQGEQLRAVVSSLPVVLWAVDNNGVFTLSTGKGLSKLGLSEGQVVGRSIYEQYSHNQGILDCVGQALAGKSCSNLVEEGGVAFESYYSPLINNGRIEGVIGIAIDVTERSSLEEQLRQAQKMEALGTLAGGIAHDFNNILQGILGFADLTDRDLKDEALVRANLDEVVKGAQRGRDLVSQILTFSRKKAYTLAPLFPAPIIKETLKLLRASLPSSVTIREEIDAECGPILADPTGMHQLLMNLCTNALQAMANEEGVLTVSLSRKDLAAEALASGPSREPGPFVELMVRDTGQGINEAILGRIFDPFFTSKEVGKGTGLGLSVVHGIIDNFGGMIKVVSSPAQGSSFFAYFPIIAAPVGEEEPEKPVAADFAPPGSERILFVDDETSIVRLQKTTLERLGYQVTGLANSQEALELFRRAPQAYDLVITDQTMPELPGKKLAEELLKIRADIPIILCTGHSATISEKEALRLGLKAFAMKPIDRKEMARMIREVLDQARPGGN